MLYPGRRWLRVAALHASRAVLWSVVAVLFGLLIAVGGYHLSKWVNGG